MNKLLTTLGLSIIGAIATPLFIPIMVLVGLNLTDYVTAIMGAKINSKAIRSDVGIRGIFKKVSMWLLVLMALLLDVLISHIAAQFGADDFTSMRLSIITAYWLCANEAISVLENISTFGDHVPPFLKSGILKIKDWLEGDQ